jgi:hypothetical protein
MADQPAQPAAAADAKAALLKCAETGAKLKKTKRYYREGHYFVNRSAFMIWKKKRVDAKSAQSAEAPKSDETAASN